MAELLLSPRDTADGRRLGAAAKRRGWKATTLSSWRTPVDAAFGRPLLVYGEPLFARIVASQNELLLLEPPHDWLGRVDRSLTRRKISVLTFDQLGALSYPCFLKPPDDKIFPAKVYASPEALTERSDIDADQLIIASEPVIFAKEFRVHFCDWRAVSQSLYSVAGELAPSRDDPGGPDAITFAQSVVDSTKLHTPPAVVVDVGILSDGNWAVIEANPAFGAGLYDAEADPILDVLLQACQPAGKLPAGLAQFTFPVTIE